MKYISSVKYCFKRMKFIISLQCPKCIRNVCKNSPYEMKPNYSYVSSNVKEKSILFKSTTLPNSSNTCTRNF